jgi:hypothetical protein
VIQSVGIARYRTITLAEHYLAVDCNLVLAVLPMAGADKNLLVIAFRDGRTDIRGSNGAEFDPGRANDLYRSRLVVPPLVRGTVPKKITSC